MDDIVDRWRSFSIMDEDGGVLGVDDRVVAKGREAIRRCLFGKILIRKPVNKKALRVHR